VTILLSVSTVEDEVVGVKVMSDESSEGAWRDGGGGGNGDGDGVDVRTRLRNTRPLLLPPIRPTAVTIDCHGSNILVGLIGFVIIRSTIFDEDRSKMKDFHKQISPSNN
jgi:hypothetical protein